MCDTVGFVRHHTNTSVPVPITGMVSVSTGTVWKIPTCGILMKNPMHHTRWTLHLRVVIFLQLPMFHCQNFWLVLQSLYNPQNGSLIQILHSTFLHQSQLNCQYPQGAILQPVADVTTLPLPQVPGTLARADVHNSVPDMWAITIMIDLCLTIFIFFFHLSDFL